MNRDLPVFWGCF